MSTLRRIALVLTTVMLICFFGGCRQDELCYLHPHKMPVRVNVDWKRFFPFERPTGMTVMLFSDDENGTVYTELTNTTTHAYVHIPAGTYHTLVFNQSITEFGSFSFRDMGTHATAVVASQVGSRWYTRGEYGTVAVESEWMAVGNEYDCVLDQQEIIEHGTITVKKNNTKSGAESEIVEEDYILAHVTPRNIIQTVRIFVHIDGIYNLRSARAALSGLSEGYLLTQGKTLNSEVTYLVEEFKETRDSNDPTKGYIEGSFTCFGLPDDHQATVQENSLFLQCLLVDNETIKTFDIPVGDQIEKVITEMTCQENGETLTEEHIELHLHVQIELPDVEPAGGGSSGFDAEVEDWEEEDVDVPM